MKSHFSNSIKKYNSEQVTLLYNKNNMIIKTSFCTYSIKSNKKDVKLLIALNL